MLRITTLFAALLMVPLISTEAAFATDSGPSWSEEVAAINDVTSKSFEYAVSGYRIRMDFIAADRIRRTRLEAPDGTAGTSGEEEIAHTDLRPGVFLIAFTEADGNVVDVFDLQRKRVFINYITNDGKRFQSETTFEDVTP